MKEAVKRYQKHYRINHSADEFAIGTNHINGIEGFWGIAKVRHVKEHFLLALKRVRV